jgi:integrase
VVASLNEWAGLLVRGDAETPEATIMDGQGSPRYLPRYLEAVSRRFGDAPMGRSLAEFESFLLDHLGRKENTVRQRIRDLMRVSSHPVYPVDLHAAPAEFVSQVVAFLSYRRSVEGKRPTALVNDLKCLRLWASFNGLDVEALPAQPTVPRKARMRLPTPEDIHDLLHASYGPDQKRNPEAQLVRAMLVWSMLGWRFPSEAFAARLDDLDRGWHTVVIHEAKKAGTTRRILVEPQGLCCGARRLSLSSYLKHRQAVDRGLTDALFVKPDGSPFASPESLRVWLMRRVQPRFPWFTGYLLRRWVTNALLIDWGFDYPRVAERLGHDSVDMTRRNYDHEARLHGRMYGKGWMGRALVRSRATPLPLELPNSAPKGGFSPVDLNAPAGERTGQQEETRPKKGRKMGSKGNDASASSPSSFPLVVVMGYATWAPSGAVFGVCVWMEQRQA